MNCPNCNGETKRHGKDRKGNQRYRCLVCGKTSIESQDKPLGSMYLAEDKALMCLNLLVEGCSVRSIERITGVHRDTVLDLLVTVGGKCEKLMDERIKNLSVRDVQADEIWAFVGMKEKTKKRQGKDDDALLGDAYTFTAIDRETKLILAWQLGWRTVKDTEAFIEKLYHATGNHFQLTTDGFGAYPDAVSYSLGTRVDYAQLVKMYALPEGERRYSPAECIGAKKIPVIGNPNPERISTSHVERQNLTIRMSTRRLTRLTNGFSKKWSNLKAALALHFAYYNFCRIHSTIRCTPAMEAGITKSVWTLKDLLKAATHF